MTIPRRTDAPALRPDLALVAELIGDGSRVLDLGCGSGELLHHLITHQACSGTGVDSDDHEVLQAIRVGIPVIELDLNTQLGEFGDRSYDVVVLSRTLQAVRQPGPVLDHMARIADRCIVSVPNFGLWRNRISLIRGHMPISKDLPWRWYDSPNLRYTTLADLEEFFDQAGFSVARRIPLNEAGRPLRTKQRAANLLAGSAVYELTPRRDERAQAGLSD